MLDHEHPPPALVDSTTTWIPPGMNVVVPARTVSIERRTRQARCRRGRVCRRSPRSAELRSCAAVHGVRTTARSPRSTSTLPRGVVSVRSVRRGCATALVLGSPTRHPAAACGRREGRCAASWRVRVRPVDRPCFTCRSATTSPCTSRTQTWCISVAQSTPTNRGLSSVILATARDQDARRHRVHRLPCTGARGAPDQGAGRQGRELQDRDRRRVACRILRDGTSDG